MARSQQYVDGYRAAWRDAIAEIHKRGDGMNDEKAKHCIYGIAFALGQLKGFDKLTITPSQEKDDDGSSKGNVGA